MKQCLKSFLVTVLLIGSGVGLAAEGTTAHDDSILIKVEPQKYKVRIEATITPTRNSFVAYLPFPQSNAFQEIEPIAHTPGELYDVPGAPGEKLLKVAFTAGAPKTVIFHEYYATLCSAKADFSKVTEIFPYDTESELYRQYTRAEPPHIDPDNEHVRRIAAELVAATQNDLEFARMAFLYVHDNIEQTYGSYKYNLPLDKTMNQKKGVAHAMSNAIISILRAKGIPARHVSALNVSGTPSLWQEFYLEKYGWIPFRVTSRPKAFDVESFFGMAVAPAGWFGRQPHCVILGHTLSGELPGFKESRTIKNYRSKPSIYVDGIVPSNRRLLIEKVED